MDTKSLIVRHIPGDIARGFKAACAKKGTTMQAELVRMMTEAAAKEGRKR